MNPEPQPTSARIRVAQRFTRPEAEGEQGQAEQHRAGQTQDALQQLAPCGQLDLIVGEGQGGAERIQQACPVGDRMRWDGEADPVKRDRQKRGHHGEPGHGPPRLQAVTGHKPVSRQDAALHPAPRDRAGLTAGVADADGTGTGAAAHLHLAVVEVGGTRLVLSVLAALAQRPVQSGDLPRVQDVRPLVV